jgi:hypothetical protein
MKKNNTIRTIIKQEVRTVLNEQDFTDILRQRNNLGATDVIKKSIPLPVIKNVDEVISEINKSINKAKQYWRNKINDPETAMRWQRSHGKSAKEWEKIKRVYLALIQMSFTNPKTNWVVSKKYPEFVGQYKHPIKNEFYSLSGPYGNEGSNGYVFPSSPKRGVHIIFIPTKLEDGSIKIRTKASDLFGLYVHEIQHFLFAKHPLTSKKRIQKITKPKLYANTRRMAFPITNDVKEYAEIIMYLFGYNYHQKYGPGSLNRDGKDALADEKAGRDTPGSKKLKRWRGLWKGIDTSAVTPPGVPSGPVEDKIIGGRRLREFFNRVIRDLRSYYEFAGEPIKSDAYYIHKICYHINRSKNCKYALDDTEMLSRISKVRSFIGRDIPKSYLIKCFEGKFFKGKGNYNWLITAWSCSGFAPNLIDIYNETQNFVYNDAGSDDLGDKTQTMA